MGGCLFFLNILNNTLQYYQLELPFFLTYYPFDLHFVYQCTYCLCISYEE